MQLSHHNGVNYFSNKLRTVYQIIWRTHNKAFRCAALYAFITFPDVPVV